VLTSYISKAGAVEADSMPRNAVFDHFIDKPSMKKKSVRQRMNRKNAILIRPMHCSKNSDEGINLLTGHCQKK